MEQSAPSMFQPRAHFHLPAGRMPASPSTAWGTASADLKRFWAGRKFIWHENPVTVLTFLPHVKYETKPHQLTWNVFQQAEKLYDTKAFLNDCSINFSRVVSNTCNKHSNELEFVHNYCILEGNMFFSILRKQIVLRHKLWKSWNKKLIFLVNLRLNVFPRGNGGAADRRQKRFQNFCSYETVENTLCFVLNVSVLLVKSDCQCLTWFCC